MSSAYQASFHKITRLDELPFGEAKTFRAAGATIVLRRTETGVTAFDGARRERPQELPSRIEAGEVWVCIDACIR